MTIAELIIQLKKVSLLLDQKYPIEDRQKKVFARFMKTVEEFGELSDATLSQMNLQRPSKLQNFQHSHVEEEWADTLGSLLLLGLELDIDIEKAIEKKLEHIFNRLEHGKDN